MARKLKTFQTSMGFFDLAIAAPSMKAALEAWGSKTNLFHMKLAQETTDPAVVEATMAKPGVVLKRTIGTTGAFKLEAKLPTHLPGERTNTKKQARPAKSPTKSKPNVKAEKAAAAAYEREERKLEKAARKEKADRKRRDAAVSKVEAEIRSAELEHQKCGVEIDAERVLIDKKFKLEEARWNKQQNLLQRKLRNARR